MVVLCSEATPNSEWVDLEVRQFRQKNPDAPVLLVVSSDVEKAVELGERILPRSSLELINNLWVDLRPDEGGYGLGLLRIVSGILQVSFEQVYKRHQRQRTRRLISLGLSSALVVLVMLTLAVFGLFSAQQRQLAELEREKTELATNDQRYASTEVLVGLIKAMKASFREYSERLNDGQNPGMDILHTSEQFFRRARLYEDSYFFEEFLLLEAELEMLKADTFENAEDTWAKAVRGFRRALDLMAQFSDSEDASNAAYVRRNAEFACSRLDHIYDHEPALQTDNRHSLCGTQ